MADPRRSEQARSGSDPARDSRVEQLLVDGLDLYFAGRYEDAIHLWTRVLFLDRAHDRARAYIDRARTAMAERHRRADEWLHDSEALLAEGRVDAARDLLDRAVAAAGDDDLASAVRTRLDRLERAHAAREAARGRMAPAPAAPAAARRAMAPWVRLALLGLAAVGAAGLGLVLLSRADRAPATDGAALGVTGGPTRLPVLSAADVALVRARTLFARGRLAEALQALDRVGPESADREAADQLKVQIQQLLLATSRVRSPATGEGDGR